MAKLIFMFREPVSRSYSHYQMSLRRGLDHLPFARAIEKEAQRMVTGILPAGVIQSVRNWILVRNMRTGRIRPVDASVRTRLSELYRADIIGLSQVIEKDLSGWLKCVQP